MRTIYLDTRDPVVLGKSGDNNCTVLRLDAERWYTEYPDGHGVILFMRPNKVIFPLETTLVEYNGRHYLESVVTSNETKLAGFMLITAQWYDGETLVHGRCFSAKVLASAGDAVDPTELTPTWVQNLIEGVAEAKILLEKTEGLVSSEDAKAGQTVYANGDGTCGWKEDKRDTVHIQRMFRFAVSKYENVGQCVAYTGHSLLFGAPSRSNTVQRIIETDMEGNILEGRDVGLTHEEGVLDASYYIGHMNDFCFHNGDIYTIGRDHTIVRIKYADLSCNVEEDVFPLEVSEYSYYGAYGISSWNGDLYVNTVINNDTYNPVVFKVNLETRTLERVCQYSEPTIYNGLHPVKQGFEVHGGYGYSIYNYDNQILKIDLTTGEVVKIYRFELGDGYYPIGEVENVVFIGGQMFMTTVLWINSPFWTQTIGQFFKTDVGGIVTPSSDNGQSDQTYGALYVDGTSTLNNPDGTVNRPFNSIEEACHVFIYRHRFTNIDETSLAVVNAQGLEGQYFYLQNVAVSANLGNAELSGIQLRGCRGMLRNFVTEDARLFYSDLFLTNCEITTLTQAQACTLNVNGTIGAVTQLERSILNFFGYNHPLDTTFTLTEAGLNTCEIHGAGRGLNIVGTTIPIKSGTTACTITLPENSITAAKLYAARNVGMTVRAAVGITDIAAATQYIVEWRLTMDHMATIRSGGDPGWVHTAFVVPSTTKGSLIVCRIACKVMLTQIRFSVTEFYRADTGTDIDDANISIFDINLLSSGRDLI